MADQYVHYYSANPRDEGCRYCQALTAGSCGRHPSNIPAPSEPPEDPRAVAVIARMQTEIDTLRSHLAEQEAVVARRVDEEREQCVKERCAECREGETAYRQQNLVASGIEVSWVHGTEDDDDFIECDASNTRERAYQAARHAARRTPQGDEE